VTGLSFQDRVECVSASFKNSHIVYNLCDVNFVCILAVNVTAVC